MKTDINKIMKKGAATKVATIDYSSPAQKKKLAEMKKKSEMAMKNKEVNMSKLANYYITR